MSTDPTNPWRHIEQSIPRLDLLPDQDPAGPLQRLIGGQIWKNMPDAPSHPATPPPILHDIRGLIGVAHRLVRKTGNSEKAHSVVNAVGNYLLRLVVDPEFLMDQQTMNPDDAAPEPTIREIAPNKPAIRERAASREAWTSLKFRSASEVVPYFHTDGTGDNDRSLDDAEHGIFGVFDGVGTKTNSGEVAEIVRDFVHDALLSAAKPTSVEAAEQMLRDIFNDARAECERLKIKGSTTANVSFAVEIDGKNYLIVGNAGDSVCYQENLTAADARSVTKEQLYEPYPYRIFNSIGSTPNLANHLTNQELARWEFDPKSIDPETNLPKFSPNPNLLRDEVTHIELKPGMRFVHASDGISGDYIDERLEPSVFGDAMRRGEPAATVRYLINRSIKNDDKSVVAFIVEAA